MYVDKVHHHQCSKNQPEARQQPMVITIQLLGANQQQGWAIAAAAAAQIYTMHLAAATVHAAVWHKHQLRHTDIVPGWYSPVVAAVEWCWQTTLQPNSC